MYVVYHGCGRKNGYGLALSGGEWFCLQGGGEKQAWWLTSGVQCDVGKWTHLALVVSEGGTCQFWVNGRLAKDFGSQSDIIMPSGQFAIGGPRTP